MKTINDWEKFLELNSGTWKNAKNKAKHFNQYDLANRFSDKKEESESDEYEEYYFEFENIVDPEESFTIYTYIEMNDQNKTRYGDIKKIEDLDIQDIDRNSDLKTEINFFQDLVIKIYYMIPEPIDKRSWKFTTKKEALRFIELFNKIVVIYNKYAEKRNDTHLIKEIPLNQLRFFYETRLEELYQKEVMSKNTKKYGI